MEIFFGIYVNFGKWNQRETMPEGATKQGRTLGPCGHPIRRLVPFFWRKKSNIQIKIVLKFQPNQSYGSPGIYETVKGQKQGARKQKGTERERSNLGGALAPPLQWRPWTRGETLLPSMGKVKKEEE